MFYLFASNSRYLTRHGVKKCFSHDAREKEALVTKVVLYVGEKRKVMPTRGVETNG